MIMIGIIDYLIEYNEKMKVISDGVDTIKRDISEKTDRNEQLSKRIKH